MNSSCFISHHLFVSAAGHENRAQVRPSPKPREPETSASRGRTRPVNKAANEPKAALQMELPAALAAAG